GRRPRSLPRAKVRAPPPGGGSTGFGPPRAGARRGSHRAARARVARTAAARSSGRAAPTGQLALSNDPRTGTVRGASFPLPCRHMSEITVIGGGVAGLTSAITCAEAGANVTLFEAHQLLG